jgi:tripartite-type tricarboxylate transporter receptor subunit TctC
MFKAMTGVDMIHIPYRADVFSDLISGQVQVYFGAMAASIEYIRAGRLRAVAVTTATRSAALPDLPTVGEFVPGYEWSSWYGIGAPKGTPADIVDTLNRAVNAGLADPKRGRNRLRREYARHAHPGCWHCPRSLPAPDTIAYAIISLTSSKPTRTFLSVRFGKGHQGPF